MTTLREGAASSGIKVLAPMGQYLGQPRFRWQPQPDAWLYRVELARSDGAAVGKGWSGQHELPIAWLRTAHGDPPQLAPGEAYRWRVYAFKDGPDGPPCAASEETEFTFLGP